MRAEAAPELDPPALPPLFRHHVRRPRLTSLLDASGARLIVLNAPAGYGKTTLAAEWLQGRPEDEVAWYYAGPASADVAALSVDLADAVSHILPAGERVRQRLRVPHVPPNNAEILAELLAHDLVHWPEQAWLVIDDYHHVMDSKSAERFVAELLRLAPIRLLVTTRRRPGWLHARDAIYGRALELMGDDLAMDEGEASRVLSVGTGAKTPELLAEGQGWPALLGLAALAEAGEVPVAHVTDALFRFFAEEVLRDHPAPVQEVLVRVSVLQRIDDDVVRACLPEVDVHTLLRHLRLAGLIRDAGGFHVIHPLFRQFLLEKLTEEAPELAEALVGSAIAHYVAMENWDDAFALALGSGDFDQAAMIIGSAATSLLESGKLETLLGWIGAAGPATLRYPAAALANAEALLRQARFSEAEAIAAAAVDRLAGDEDLHSRGFYVIGQANYLRGDYSEALAHHRSALKYARTRDDRMRAAWGALLAAIELAGDDVPTHLATFKRVAPSDPDARIRLLLADVLTNALAGSLHGSWARIQSALKLCDSASDPLAISNALSVGAWISIGHAEYRVAHDLSTRGLRYAYSLRLEFTEGHFLADIVSSSLGLRRFREARTTLGKLAHLIAETEDLHLRYVYENLATQCAILGLDFDALGRFGSARVDEASYFRALRGEGSALQAVLHASDGALQAADEACQRCCTLTRSPAARSLERFARAIMDLHAYGSKRARDTFESALVEAQHVSHFDSLVIAYRSCPDLLELLSPRSSLAELVGKVAVRANDMALASEASLPIPVDASLVRLTSREEEVMNLLALGLTNGEIARHLYISPATAKVHVRHIMKKLGARTRTDAVLRWRSERVD